MVRVVKRKEEIAAMKRITLALVMAGLSASAFAGAPKDQVAMPSGINLIAPDSIGVWSFGVEALYMEPTNNDFQYAQTTDTVGANASSNNESTDREHHWGGTVDATYLFAGNSRDVKLSFTHIDFDSSDHTGVDAGDILTPAGGFISAFTNGTARASQDDDYNAVDLVFGQWIRIGDRVDLHPFGGLRYASIDTDAHASYFNVSTTTVPTADRYQKFTSDFDGIGPRGGIDTAVHLGDGFSIVGTVGASLLIGDVDSKYRATDSTGLVATNVFENDDRTSVIPELDARIGVDYMYAFTPTTSMNVQLGYQVVNYFDVSDLDAIDAVTPNTVNNTEDFGYHGPYLRLQVNLA